MIRAIMNMNENRHFYVQMGDKKSRRCRMKNGVPQGSVIAPALFNLYTYDMPVTVRSMFMLTILHC